MRYLSGQAVRWVIGIYFTAFVVKMQPESTSWRKAF
jgi:hypothetical protein